jgi:hypothetical protein
MRKIKNYIHNLIVRYFEVILLPMAFSDVQINYSSDGSIITTYMSYKKTDLSFFSLVAEYKLRKSKFYRILFNVIFIIHAFMEKAAQRQNEVHEYISRTVDYHNDKNKNERHYKYLVADSGTRSVDLTNIIKNCLVITNIPDLNIPYSSFKFNNIYEFLTYLREADHSVSTDEYFIFDVDFIEEYITELCTDDLPYFITRLFGHTTVKFTQFYKDRLFDINGDLDFAFLLFSLLVPNRRKMNREQLKRILNCAPRTLDYYLLDDDGDDETIDQDKISNNSHYFIVNSDDFFENDHSLFQLMLSYIIKDEQLDDNHIQIFDNTINNMYKNYTDNQIEQLFSCRHGFFYYPLTVLPNLEKVNKTISSYEVEVLPVVKTWRDLGLLLSKNKEINNEELLEIDGKTIDGMHFKILKTINDYREASSLFNNCILSYFTEYPDQDVVVLFNTEDNKAIGCLAVEDREVVQILGPHNRALDSIISGKINDIMDKIFC